MATSKAENLPFLALIKSPDTQFATGMIAVVFMMFIPLPPFILDVLLSMSIAISFLALLISIYVKEPLDFSSFPTFLLLSTLFRLSLNIATTRNILLDGSTGNVSKIITAFGDFVVGGNYFVGFVIFLILIIINFLVITKGAGRVAEVGARFTLDAMPGKQMSIDADLNAGIIDRDEAKKRRKKIENEADFYGSMDGASKFVRGDAIAAIIITAINIVVGLGLGVFKHGMSFSDAAQVYTLLTVGDGLVSQIPSIVISVAAGIVVTRASGEEGLTHVLTEQIFMKPKALYLCGSLLFFMGLLPGLPMLSFFFLSGLLFFVGNASSKKLDLRKERFVKEEKEKNDPSKTRADSVEALLHVDTLSLEVGVNLIPLVDSEQNGEILERIVSARKQFAQDLGIIVPMVMVRDNIQIKASDYQVLLKGNVVARGSLLVDHELAMAPEDIVDPIDGLKTKEPAYGLDAVWIKSSQKEDASFKGYTVVNGSTVVVTHLTKVISEHSHELLGRQEVQSLISTLKEKYPKVVEEVIASDALNLGHVVKVLQNLLVEGISIRDMLTIFESLADFCKTIKNPDALTRYVRKALGRSIVKKFLNEKQVLQVISLDRGAEDVLLSCLKINDDYSTSLNMSSDLAQKLLDQTAIAIKFFEKTNSLPILVCGASIRWDLRKIISHFIPDLSVISFDEIPKDIKVNSLATVSF